MEWRFEIMYSFNNVTEIKDFRLAHDVIITNNEINMVTGAPPSFASPDPFTNNVVDRNPPPAFTSHVEDRNPPPVYANADDSSDDSSVDDEPVSHHSYSAYPPVSDPVSTPVATSTKPSKSTNVIPNTPALANPTMTLTANFEGRGYGSSNEINENESNTASNTTSDTRIYNDASSSTPLATPLIQALPILPPKPTHDELVRSNTNTNFNPNPRSVPQVPQRSTQLQVPPPSVPSRSSQSHIPQPVFPERVGQAQRSTSGSGSGSGSPLHSNNPFSTPESVSGPSPPSVPSGPPPLLGVTDPNVSALHDPLPPFPIQNYANLGNIDFNNILGNTRTPIVPGFSRNDFPELIGDNGEMKIDNFNDRTNT
ncbi:unnamed protein product [[Candida] boidinii]|nr:unnamed protein product [[Candida] boidinii]